MAAALCLFISNGWAQQDVTVEAEISARKVALGSSVQLTISVNGGKNVVPVQLPDIDGFDAKYLGPSTRVSIINGQYRSSRSYAYSLLPLKVGHFQIPVVDVDVSGQIYRTAPIDVEVVESVMQASSDDKPGASLSERIFVVLKVPKTEFFLHEPIPVKILLFSADIPVQNIRYPTMDGVGFTSGEYAEPKQYDQVIQGVRYGIVEFNTQVYPTRAGELSLGPAGVDCNLLVQNAGNGSSSRTRPKSLFDDDFFNAFFDRYEKRPITLRSEDVKMTILPLPEEGKPVGFSGAVGQYDFNVSVSPTDIKEGDPITLRMTVVGKGNLAVIQMPSLSAGDDFKLYDPQLFEKDNIKKSEQVIIPQSDRIKEVPAVEFSFFDPQIKKYHRIKRGPFSISVAKLKQEEAFKVVGLDHVDAVKSAESETFGQDIVYIKSQPGKFREIGRRVYHRVDFYVIIFTLLVLWMGALNHYQRTHRIRTDTAYARRLIAPKKARQGLAQAQKLLAAGKKEEFYDTVFKTIQQYLGNKLHLPVGSVTLEAVQNFLDVKNVGQKICDDVKQIFEECEMIRYASAEINKEDMKDSYQRVASAIDVLERSLK